MPNKQHIYRVGVEWTGNPGRGYNQLHGLRPTTAIRAGTKPPIAGSDPARSHHHACSLLHNWVSWLT
jgi:hypothetical protein